MYIESSPDDSVPTFNWEEVGTEGIQKMQEGCRKQEKNKMIYWQSQAIFCDTNLHSWAFTSLLGTDRVSKHTDILR